MCENREMGPVAVDFKASNKFIASNVIPFFVYLSESRSK